MAENMNSEAVTLLGFRHMVHTFPADEEKCTLLAIHGFGTTGRSFRHAAPMLNDAGISVVAPDQLNFGESEKPEDGYSLRLYAQLVLETADTVGVERPYLLGHSAGGKVAAATVALFPDRFAGLVLVNSGGFSRLAPILLLADTPLFRLADTAFFRKRILRGFNVSEAVDAPDRWEAFTRFQGQNAALDIDRTGLRPAVRAIKTPTLVVWGRGDKMIPFGTVDRIRRDIPHAEVTVMADSGHSPMHDEPAEFAEIVSRFCLNTGLESRRPGQRTISRSDSGDL